MRETPEDLLRLERLLDESYQGAGIHLTKVITAERRVRGQRLVELLEGVQILVLATVTPDGRPLVGPVDGLFYKGEFWFGSAPDSVRFRHLRRRPQVSASHVRGEELAVTVHGTAHEVRLGDAEHGDFWDLCVETYGASWLDWREGTASYARIEPHKVFAAEFWGV